MSTSAYKTRGRGEKAEKIQIITFEIDKKIWVESTSDISGFATVVC